MGFCVRVAGAGERWEPPADAGVGWEVLCSCITTPEGQQKSAPLAGSVHRLRQALVPERTFPCFEGEELQASLKGE